MKTRLETNRTASVILFSSVLLIIFSQKVLAQQHYFRPERATYLGGSVSMAFPSYVLKSNISAIDNQRVSYTGANVGGMLANSFGKLTTDIGLYYSNSSVANSMQMTQESVSGSVYFLRLKKGTKYHTFEPYVKVGLTEQQTKFFGNYIGQDGSTQPTNYSTSSQPLLNVSFFTQMKAGVGVEYQLENYMDRFVQLFAEVDYGSIISSTSSTSAFGATSTSNQTLISFGVSFGIIK